MMKSFFFITVILLAAVVFVTMPRALRADSIRLLADLEYTSTDSSTTNKQTGVTSESERSLFSQLYNLDIGKEFFPTIVLNGGGVFDLESTDNETDGSKTETKTRNIRPFAELHLTTPLLQAGTSYRQAELKQSGTTVNTTRRFTEEYNSIVNWKPVDLPRLGLSYTRSLSYDEPMTTDSAVDLFELRSKYAYEDFNFDYSHTTNDSLQKVSGYKTLTNTDIGAVRYHRPFYDGKVSVSAGVRYSRDKSEFSGVGDRLVDTSSPGTSFYNLDDPPPATSSTAGDFTSGPLNNVNLLGVSTQLSFGLDFGTSTTVDTLHAILIQPSSDNNQASASEIDSIDHLFSWSVYVSEDQETWTNTAVTSKSLNIFENRFELVFGQVSTRYIKIVTTPLAQSLLPGKEILISQIEAKETLPPDTSEFTQTNMNSDLAANWKMSESTSSGCDFRYREDKSKPQSLKKTYLTGGAHLRHIFNPIFSGNTRLTRSEIREQGNLANTNHTYSASLTGRYLDTFNQSLTYSFTDDKDADEGTSTSNAILLRSNMDLYQGWSMNLDNGYSWQYPAAGGTSTSTFARLGSSISPNQWLNLTISYGVTWGTQTGQPASRDQNGSLVVSWVPFSSLSMSADLSFIDREGRSSDSSARQTYSINWSPFRDGTLQFSLGYGEFQNTEDEKTSNLTPSLKWQITRNSLLTVDYSIGELEDADETGDYENFTISLRIYY